MDGSAARRLGDLLASVSAPTPAPGGGSAAAWAGALAAALTQMAASFAGEEEAAARAGSLQAELVALGEQDLTAYQPVLEAMRVPADQPSRAERLASALSDASQTPLAISRATAELAELGASVASRNEPALRGDAVVGVLLAEAACRSAARLVEINLAACDGDPRTDESLALAARAGAARARVLEGR